MRKIKKNKRRGQAVVEYVIVLMVIVFILVWGLGRIKCELHKYWIRMACDIIHPYPYKDDPNKQPFCEPLQNCFEI